jgi:predicted PurR-regulated permease PerM
VPFVEWRKQVGFWLIAAAVFIGLLVVFEGILLPFVAGLFIAYLLNPVNRAIQRLGVGRQVATTIIVAAFLVAFATVLLFLIPVLINQAINLIGGLPSFATSVQAYLDTQVGAGRLADILNVDAEKLRSAVEDFVGQGAEWLLDMVQSVWSGGQAMVQSLALLVLTPVVAFYVLLDWNRMVAAIDRNLPRDHRETIHRLLAEMDQNVSGFIHGQLLVGMLLGIFYATALLIVGLDHAILIGLGAGLISFIPYLGSIIGFFASVGVALNQFWPDFVMIGAVAGIFVFGQFVEGNILQPRLVGNKVGLHPVWLIFALIAFGSLFGFAGMLIAVPAASAVGVLLRFGLEKYRESPLYLGTGGEAHPGTGGEAHIGTGLGTGAEPPAAPGTAETSAAAVEAARGAEVAQPAPRRRTRKAPRKKAAPRSIKADD